MPALLWAPAAPALWGGNAPTGRSLPTGRRIRPQRHLTSSVAASFIFLPTFPQQRVFCRSKARRAARRVAPLPESRLSVPICKSLLPFPGRCERPGTRHSCRAVGTSPLGIGSSGSIASTPWCMVWGILPLEIQPGGKLAAIFPAPAVELVNFAALLACFACEVKGTEGKALLPAAAVGQVKHMRVV